MSRNCAGITRTYRSAYLHEERGDRKLAPRGCGGGTEFPKLFGRTLPAEDDEHREPDDEQLEPGWSGHGRARDELNDRRHRAGKAAVTHEGEPGDERSRSTGRGQPPPRCRPR